MESQEVFIAPVVQVNAKEPARGGLLENVSFRRLGDHDFIVGRLAAQPNFTDSRVGQIFWFACDDVYIMTEFPDLATAIAAREKTKAERLTKEEPSTNHKKWWQR